MKNVFILFMIFFLTSCVNRWYESYGLDKDQLSSVDAAPKLIEALSDPNPDTRNKALNCLNRLVPATEEIFEAIEQVEKNDKDPNVRRHAYGVKMKLINYARTNKSYNAQQLLADDLNIELTIQPNFKFYTGYKNEAVVRKTGILPVTVKIKNISSNHLILNQLSYKLLSASGTAYKIVPPQEASEKLHFSYKGSIISTILFAPVGVASIIKNNSINNDIDAHIKNATGTNTATISPNEVVEDLIFFDVSQELKYIDGCRFEMIMNTMKKTYIIENDFINPIAIK